MKFSSPRLQVAPIDTQTSLSDGSRIVGSLNWDF